ncbi:MULTISPECIES: hypothetical protein [Microbacterium]|uniref:hypothetical protein n=1 Tax=Microbacterium TaxID=33882 RepID=UPI00146DF1C7|nr:MULTISPECIES: hypothetical protein [Microbacterium]
MLHDRRRRALRSAATALLLTSAAILTVACQPEPDPSSTPSGSTSPTAVPTITATPTPIETQLPDAFQVPGGCEEIYSAEMIATLEADAPPLNDPGVTMLSTQNVDLIQIIDGGAPTLRCSWGGPSEYGLATNVTAVDSEQAELIEAELAASGFACESLDDGTICRIEQKGITLDDEEYTSGETHYVGGGGWVSTSWLNFSPDGYTEDIVATVWG